MQFYKSKYLKYKKKYIDLKEKICDSIFDDDNKYYTNYLVIENLLNFNECDNIIEEGDKYAALNGWTKKRHENYPTTDNLIKKDWDCYKLLENVTKNKIYDNFEKLFKINKNRLEIEELFLSKYSNENLSDQSDLETHIDGSEFSFVISLNDNYEGGGTYFREFDEVIRLKKGDCLIFCGQRDHGGSKVSNGSRYVVAGFLNYKLCDSYRD